MKTKSIFASAFLTLIVGFFVIYGSFNERKELPGTFYQVYLDGQKIGLIVNKDELYNLINDDQHEIRRRFGVDRVHPPNGFEIVRFTTFSPELTSAQNVYNQIKGKKPFTIQGHIVNIQSELEETGEVIEIQLFVLDEEIFEAAIKRMITAFVDALRFENYLNDTQDEIQDVGELITAMYFADDITIREGFIASDAKIFTNVDELSRFLLFGTIEDSETYVVEPGDSIENIAFNHALNTQEFLIANPRFTSEFSLLAIGEEVNVSLIAPILNLVYEKTIVEDRETDPGDPIVEVDFTRHSGYRSVTREAEKGIERITRQSQFINGRESQQVFIQNITEIKAPVREIVVRGRQAGGVPFETTTAWAWPTNAPFVISSPFGYRGGEFHDAIDITGPGWGSPIYAARDGVVYATRLVDDSAAGLFVTIDHENGYFTSYMHLSRVEVVPGQRVTRGQTIGRMGNTGRVIPRPTPEHPTRGTHLHFVVNVGAPFGRAINPMTLYR